MKVSVISLGCSKNLVDSEVLIGKLLGGGASFTKDPSEADVILINTCGFVEEAKRESIDAILSAVETGKRVLVMGCLSQRYMEELRKELPEVEEFFGTESWDLVVSHLGLEPSSKTERFPTTPSYAYLKIAEGCNRSCSFCAIPRIRGKHRSRPVEEILDEARGLADRGYKELVVISQDTTYYGVDLYRDWKLTSLLKELEKIEGIRWIRLHYLYPTEVTDELINFIAESEKVLPYFDVPFQHISDRVLKDMRRGYTERFVRNLIERILKKIPRAVLRSTFIVGFPTEGEEDFKRLENFISEGFFYWAGFFKYSHEEGTHSFSLGDRIPDEEKNRRLSLLNDIQSSVLNEKNEEHLGRIYEVLVDGVEEGKLIARTWFQAPEVDGLTLVRADNLSGVNPGSLIRVRIAEATYTDLIAEAQEL
jgi:ribosomal protein S12 methylthiotransferase